MNRPISPFDNPPHTGDECGSSASDADRRVAGETRSWGRSDPPVFTHDADYFRPRADPPVVEPEPELEPVVPATPRWMLAVAGAAVLAVIGAAVIGPAWAA